MICFDDEQIEKEGTNLERNSCDIFEPSMYAPDNSKYRAEYIERISAKIKDVTIDDTEADQVGEASVNVRVGGTPLERTFEFVFKALKGVKGDQGDAAVERMTISDFNRKKEAGEILGTKFYFVTSNSDALLRIFAGTTLIARSDSGSIFPLTFPFTFSS